MTGARSRQPPARPERPALSHPFERAVERLAPRQHGVVTRAQLLAAGVSADVVDHRVKTGRLRPVHRGVYRVGPVEPPHARIMAGVLACGPSAVASHRSAGGLWRLNPAPAGTDPVEVTVRDDKRRRAGVRVRRIHTLSPDEVTKLEGIPITTPPRTLLDLAGILGAREIERAVAEAFALRLATPAHLEEVVSRHVGCRGGRSLRASLEAGDPALTRSEAEERFLALIRKAALREPQVNVRLLGYEVDFLWRRERLVVEVDGQATHGSPRAFERDRRRDGNLSAAGYRVMRVTWRQIDDEPEAMLVRLATALAVGTHA